MVVQWNTVVRSIIPAGVFGAAAFTICSQPVNGFFPPVTNGKDKVTVVVPPVSPPPVLPPVVPPVPPVPPPPFVPPPVPPVPPPPCSCPPVTPAVVPEPATLVSAGIGLAVVAGLARRRKKADSAGE